MTTARPLPVFPLYFYLLIVLSQIGFFVGAVILVRSGGLFNVITSVLMMLTNIVALVSLSLLYRLDRAAKKNRPSSHHRTV